MLLKTIILSIVIFLAVIWLLVGLLLFARKRLVPDGKVKITINGEREIQHERGCCRPFPTRRSSCLPRAAAVARVALARARCLPVAAICCPPRKPTSHAPWLRNTIDYTAK